MSEEWNEDTAIEKITQLEVWKERVERGMRFQQPDISLMTAEEVAEFKADLDAGRRKDFINDLVSLAHDALVHVGCEGGRLILPTPTIPEHANRASRLEFNLLLQEIENVQLKLESIDEAIRRYGEQFHTDRSTPQWEDAGTHYPIMFIIGSATNKRIIKAENPQQYDEIVKDARESAVILKEARKFNQAVLAIYQKEMENRKNQSTIPDLMEKAKSVAKEAETVIKNIAKSNEKFAKSRLSGRGDVECAKAFMENLEKYYNLSAQFRNICHELRYFGETHFPNFSDLITDIVSSKGECQRIVGTEMGQKASQNYQREMREMRLRRGTLTS